MNTAVNRPGLSRRTINLFGRKIILSGYETDSYFQHITNDESADLDVISLASLLIEENSNVLDIGANIGYESVAFALFAPKGHVYAFEPIPHNAQLIKKNVQANRVKNVFVYNFGLSDHKKTLGIVYNNENRGGATLVGSAQSSLPKYHDHHETVEVVKLDTFTNKLGSIRACDLLKVDIEGHEPAFLRGALKFIEKHKPSMIIEANHWCLNGLNRISLPDFIDQLESIYPHIAAFDQHEWLDIKTHRHQFLHDNIVKNQYQNLYCDFNYNKWRRNIVQHQWGWPKMESLSRKASREATLAAEENERLRQEIQVLTSANEKLMRKFSSRVASRLRHH